MKVLIADGHQGIRESLCSSLSVHGVQVVGVAVDGFDVVEQARRLAPDVVLLDIHLPRRSGLEAARTIRAQRPLAKVILLTTWEEPAYARAAAKCGAMACLPKTVRTRDLILAMGDGREAGE